MKIAMLAPFGLKAKGTVAARMLPLATALAERGHHVRLIVPPWDDPPASPALTAKSTQLEKINAVEILTLPLFPQPLVASLPLRMIWEAQKFRPDIIHVFKPKAYSGLAALGLALCHQKFVLDTDDWEGAGGYNDVNPYSPAQKLLFGWQERDLPHRARGVTVASRTLQSLVWSMGVKPERVLYLPNGVSRQKYAHWSGPPAKAAAIAHRARLGLTDKIVLLAYTRFAEFEPKRLLQIFQDVLARLSQEKAEQTRLLVVGSGFHQEEVAFQEQATEMGLAAKIIMAGQVDWHELAGWLRCADVALYPFDDTLINRARCSAKLLELLMAERAVVTESVGENREYIQDNVGGRLVKPGDNAAFAQAVTELILAEPAKRLEMGRAGAQYLWQTYEWSRLVGPLEDFYKAKLNAVF